MIQEPFSRVLSLFGLVAAIGACGAGKSPSPPAELVVPPLASASSGPRPLALEPHVRADERCLATISQRRPPAGWSPVGSVYIVLTDGQPISFEALDARQRVVKSMAAPKSAAAASRSLTELTCLLGGLIAVLEGPEPPREGASTASLVVLRPTTPDEATDVSLLCREPAEWPPGLRDNQKRSHAMGVLAEHLTTSRWRAWLADLHDEDDRSEGAARIALRSGKADELRAAMAPPKPARCYLEGLLRHPLP